MADYGIKVTLPGKGVTSTDPKDYSLHSEDFKHVLRLTSPQSGNITLTTTSPYLDTIVVTHGLGYIPFFQVFAYFNEGGTVSDTYNITTQMITPVYFTPVCCFINTNELHITTFNGSHLNTTMYWQVIFGKDAIV